VEPDVTKRETAQEIELGAARWVARVEAGELSPEDAAALSAWLAVDTRRAGAYARARAIGHFSNRAAALGPDFDPRSFARGSWRDRLSPARLSRRQLLWGGSAIAASAGVAAIAGEGLSLFAPTYASALGQMRVVSLADGSVVNLNTGSRIRVRFSRQRRDIWLDQGEALFDVAKDPSRPFVVRVGELDVMAVGTSFVVRNLHDKPFQVLVREGVVQVGEGANAVRLSANMTALPAQQDAKASPIAVSHVPPHEVERATAWLNGRIAFEDETLRAAASEFSRYSDVRIVIDDPTIANERITGLYQSVDPVSFAKSAAVIFGLKTDIAEKSIRLYR
jgi:transmembrane sensor